jgi:hypothetical protein
LGNPSGQFQQSLVVPVNKRSLSRAQFERLADIPPEEEWLANITNAKTRRAYRGY